MKNVSGKLWGKPNGEPVLAIHGVLDNCGVFDRLIPLLRGNYFILTFDLPGHGLSSHFPSGLPVDFLNFVLAAKYVVDKMGWKRFFFVGHSMGGMIGLHFTCCWPVLVKKLIVMDGIAMRQVDEGNLTNSVEEWINTYVSMIERHRNAAPHYSYEEALDRLMSRATLAPEAAEILAERSLRRTVEGYSFRMDSRLKLNLVPWISTPLIDSTVRNLQCPVMFIFSTEMYEILQDTFASTFEEIARNPKVRVEVANGTHEFHQNNPEQIVERIDEFLLMESCKI